MKPRNLILSVAVGLSMSACTAPEPATPPQTLLQPPPIPLENDLKFDMRYWDSIDLPHRSARTERELAISRQLQRLRLAQPYRNSRGEIEMPPEPDTDSVFEQASGGPSIGFANRAEELADIYRKIDSLKVLEHIPLTPH